MPEPLEIQTTRIAIEREIDRLTGEIEIKKIELIKLKASCAHPNLQKTRTGRGSTKSCPDCGYYRYVYYSHLYD